MQKASFVPQHFVEAVSVDPVAHCMRPGVVLSWEAFNAGIVDFDTEQARRYRTRRIAAAAVVHAIPEADVKHLVPPERRFDLSAFGCSAWPRSSPLVRNTPTIAPSEIPSPACAWVLNAETSESQHPALGRISMLQET